MPNMVINFPINKIKYVGLIMDSRLGWNHHINELTKKLNRAVGIIYKILSDCTLKVCIIITLLQSFPFSLIIWPISLGKEQ